ncbi:AraC family transcriptional regulator [Cohnella cellulosilytica]|uniref:AraC family transcriptional regulator n=1 Tax=Cohnella cellulosilytica TaxID=986710 RepID=A0ABW2F2S9_9BACL
MVQPSFPIVTESDSRLPLYLTSIGHWEYQERTRRPGGFPDYQWLQAISGTGELEVDGTRRQVKPGQGFFLLPNETHVYYPTSEPWGLHWIAFNGSLMPSWMNHSGIRRSGVYALSDPDSLIAQMKAIYAMSLTGRPFLGAECSKLLYALLLDLSRNAKTGSSSSPRHDQKLQPVIRFIEDNCHRVLSIDEMAARIGVSAQYLCHLFKRVFQLRPMEYVNRERINRSKELMLNEPQLKLREVAHRVGFDSPSYFSSVFKKIVGMSPEQFRGRRFDNGFRIH